MGFEGIYNGFHVNKKRKKKCLESKERMPRDTMTQYDWLVNDRHKLLFFKHLIILMKKILGQLSLSIRFITYTIISD